jgi:hypothetical protein
MYHLRKLKPDLSITGLIPAMLCLAIGFLAYIFYGKTGFYNSIALFFCLYSLVSIAFFILTRNTSYLAAAIWQLLFGLYVTARPEANHTLFRNTEIRMVIAFCLVAATVWLLYLVFTRRSKWRGRELFELASASTVVAPDGFTARPRHAGSFEYTREELKGFAEFLRRNLVAMPFKEDNRIVFVPVKGGTEFSYLVSPGKFKESRTWIGFDFSGNITVNISRRDYLDYRDELSFDQLCGNLGKLFAEFMDYYRMKEADRIIYKLDELKLSLAS